MTTPCYCGSKKEYEACCQPIITGATIASTAEQLMRARYSAYAATEIDFLHDTLHPDNRDEFDATATKQWAETSEWKSLAILATKGGSEIDKVGSVDFTATYIDADGKEHRHSERSQFKKWINNGFFATAKASNPTKSDETTPAYAEAVKKYKKCCGA